MGGYLAIQPPSKTQVYGLPGDKHLSPEEYEALDEWATPPPESTPDPSVNSPRRRRTTASDEFGPDASLLPPGGADSMGDTEGDTPGISLSPAGTMSPLPRGPQ